LFFMLFIFIILNFGENCIIEEGYCVSNSQC
jgi:hypothetical protein